MQDKIGSQRLDFGDVRSSSKSWSSVSGQLAKKISRLSFCTSERFNPQTIQVRPFGQLNWNLIHERIPPVCVRSSESMRRHHSRH